MIKKQNLFDLTENGKLINAILTDIRNEFSKLGHSDLRDEHLRNVYSTVGNIRGELKALWGKTKSPVNQSNLEVNLNRLCHILNFDDVWNQNCYILIRNNYNWQEVNHTIGRLLEIHKFKPDNTAVFRKILKCCNYTDDEMIILTCNFPYLSLIYDGPNTIIKSIGTLIT
jgi:hypothetical protein